MSTPRKLYTVGVTLRFDMVVLATDEATATAIAQRWWHDEMSDQGVEPDPMLAHPVRSRHDVGHMTDEDLEACVPWGDDSPQESIAELMEAQGIK